MLTRLKRYRFIREKSQYQLARETKIPQSRISLLENKLADPKPEEKIVLSKVLNTSPEELFEI